MYFELNTTLILSFSISLILFSYWLKSFIQLRNYFKTRNLPGPSLLPFIGNFYEVIKQGIIFHDMNIMKKYGKICGYFEGINTVLIHYIKNKIDRSMLY